MPIPLLSSAVGALMRRYGMKGLTGSAKDKLKGKAKSIAAKNARKDLIKKKGGLGKGGSFSELKGAKGDAGKAYRSERRKQVAGNALGDAATGYGGYELFSMSNEIDGMKTKKEIRDYIKTEKPKLWKEYSNSDYTDIEEFLKSKKA